MNITVSTLGLGDDRYDLIHLPVQGWITVDAIDIGGSLQPLVKVTIKPLGAMVTALLLAGRNQKVVIGRAGPGIRQQLPHAWDHAGLAGGKAVRPKARGPMDIGDVRAAKGDVGAGPGIGQGSITRDTGATCKAQDDEAHHLIRSGHV